MINLDACNLFDMLYATYEKIDDSDNLDPIVRILNHPDLYKLAHDRRYKIRPIAGTSHELWFEYRHIKYRVVAYRRNLLLYKADLESYSKEGELLYKAYVPYKEVK
jgi:hypothetical protein